MSILIPVWNWISLKVISNITWGWLRGLYRKGKYWDLSYGDWKKIGDLLREDHYVILTRRKTHLTTYLIWLGGLLKMGKGSYWSHALLNIEGDTENYELIEATSIGVHVANFIAVFDCDSVCLLRPKGYSAEDWSLATKQALEDLGKPYDTLFDPSQDASLSCVELVRDALQAAPDYLEHFPKFEAMISKYGQVIPQMVYDDGEFEKILEIRR